MKDVPLDHFASAPSTHRQGFVGEAFPKGTLTKGFGDPDAAVTPSVHW
ncbi:MAG: hypothetical protein KME21_31485 [Desmonostoc vinosum HA7617-LM4]|nr:hypothetical protein [Desmonostoc vinosum HA7617-LM4]